MKKVFLSLLLTFIFIGCTKTPEEKIADLYHKGLQEVSEFQYAKADSTFKSIYEINQTSSYGLLGEGLVNESRLEYYDAINNYLLLLSVTSTVDEAQVGLYRSYKNLGYYQEAFDQATFYYKMHTDDPDVLYLLADAYNNIGEQDRARGYCNEAIKAGYTDKGAAQFMIAGTFYRDGERDSIDTYLALARKNNSGTTEYLNQEASYFELTGAIDSAMFYSTKYYDSDNHNMNTCYTHFKRALHNNYLFDARQVIADLMKLSAEPKVLEGMWMFYSIAIEDKSQIRIHGEHYIAYNPKSFSSQMFDMITRGEISDKHTLIQDIQLIRSNVSKNEYGDEFGEFLKYAATMIFSKYEKSPMSLDYLNDIGGTRKNRKKLKLDIAVTEHIIGLFDECYKQLKILEKGHGTQADWLTGIADSWGHYAIRKYDEAERVFKKALTVDKNYLPAFQDYLKMLVRIKEYDKALALFDAYPQFEKYNESIALEKTKYYFLTGQYEQGIKQFDENFKYKSGDMVFVQELLDILKKHNRKTEEDTIVKIVEGFSSENPDGQLIIAKYEQENNDFQASMKYLDAILIVEPDNADANILKARALYHTGQKTEAYDMFEDNLKRFNNNANNLLYYSKILALENIDMTKAANLARQAAYEGYGEPAYVMNLSDIYYQMGRYDLSRGEATKVSLHFDEPHAFYRVGMCYYKEGKPDTKKKMNEAFNKAIELGLSGNELKEAKDILKKK